MCVCVCVLGVCVCASHPCVVSEWSLYLGRLGASSSGRGLETLLPGPVPSTQCDLFHVLP